MQERRHLVLRRLHLAFGMCGMMLLTFGASANSYAQGIPPVGATSTLSGGGGHVVAHGGGNGIAAVPEDFQRLTLSSGFLLSMTVYDMPEISGDLRVDDLGNVDVPMSGELHVAGMTLPQANPNVPPDRARAMLGHMDRTGGQNVSWNAAHMSQGCTKQALINTGGAGRLYCFATN